VGLLHVLLLLLLLLPLFLLLLLLRRGDPFPERLAARGDAACDADSPAATLSILTGRRTTSSSMWAIDSSCQSSSRPHLLFKVARRHVQFLSAFESNSTRTLSLSLSLSHPPGPDPPLIKRVSICLECKQLSACTILLPNELLSGELGCEAQMIFS
jgi:hypothetical protein